MREGAEESYERIVAGRDGGEGLLAKDGQQETDEEEKWRVMDQE